MREQLEELGQLVDRIDAYTKKALQSGDQAYWDAVALNLHGFYSGVERIFEDVARTIDTSVPEGPGWHADLLVQMASELNGTRPAVITRDTRICLDEYRGFRHLVRNIYAFNLRPSRILELAQDLPACYKSIVRDLFSFATFLDGIDR